MTFVRYCPGDQVVVAEEARHEAGARAEIEILGRADLLDPAEVHDDNAVGHGNGFVLIMRDKHEGRVDAALDLLEKDLHLPSQRGIQGGERLIEKNDLGLADDGPRQCDPLLLATRELGRIAVSKGA